MEIVAKTTREVQNFLKWVIDNMINIVEVDDDNYIVIKDKNTYQTQTINKKDYKFFLYDTEIPKGEVITINPTNETVVTSRADKLWLERMLIAGMLLRIKLVFRTMLHYIDTEDDTLNPNTSAYFGQFMSKRLPKKFTSEIEGILNEGTEFFNVYLTRKKEGRVRCNVFEESYEDMGISKTSKIIFSKMIMDMFNTNDEEGMSIYDTPTISGPCPTLGTLLTTYSKLYSNLNKVLAKIEETKEYVVDVDKLTTYIDDLPAYAKATSWLTSSVVEANAADIPSPEPPQQVQQIQPQVQAPQTPQPVTHTPDQLPQMQINTPAPLIDNAPMNQQYNMQQPIGMNHQQYPNMMQQMPQQIGYPQQQYSMQQPMMNMGYQQMQPAPMMDTGMPKPVLADSPIMNGMMQFDPYKR